MKRSDYILTISLVIFSVTQSSQVFAANECKISYGWNTGNSAFNTFKNVTGTITLNKGQSKIINKQRMNFVKNLKTQKVKIYLQGVLQSPITLAKNQANPNVGNYAGTPKLLKVKCLLTSASASGGNVTASSMASGLKATGKTAVYIAQKLKNQFSQNVMQITQLLKTVGFSRDAVADALKRGVNANAAQTYSALKSKFFANTNTIIKSLVYAKFSGLEIVKTLKLVVRLSPSKAASAMRSTGSSTQRQTNQIAKWIIAAYRIDDSEAMMALVPAKFSINSIIEFGINVAGLGVNVVVEKLKTKSVRPRQIAQGLYSAGVKALPVAKALKRARWGSSIVMTTLSSVYKLSNTASAAIFKQAGYTASETTNWLKTTPRLSRELAKRTLEIAKYSAREIKTALARYYGVVQATTRRVSKPFRNTKPQKNDYATPAVAAAVLEIQIWFLKAEIYNRRCRITAQFASGSPGVFGSSYRWSSRIRNALIGAGMESRPARKWEKSFRKAFDNWANAITIQNLPWYPAFVAFPGPMAPPMPNVPTPLAMLIPRSNNFMSRASLQRKMLSALRSSASNEINNAIKVFTVQIDSRLKKYLSTAMVGGVMGSGPVPSFKSSKSPGPVLGGNCAGRGILAGSKQQF